MQQEKKKPYESGFNNKFSREPVYGEGVRTYEEEGRSLLELQEALDNKTVELIGASIIGRDIPPAVRAKLKTLDTMGMLGSSVFCGENVEIITEDGGIIVIGDNCVIYNTTFRVLKGAVLMLEDVIILDSKVTITQGEHKLTCTTLARCTVENSTLHDIESKESEIKLSLLKSAHFKDAQIIGCIGSAGGAEIGGIYQSKTFSYDLDPYTGRLSLRVEDLERKSNE